MKLKKRRHAVVAASVGLAVLAVVVLPGGQSDGGTITLSGPPPYDVWVNSTEDYGVCPPNTVCAEVWDSATGTVSEACCIEPSGLYTNDHSACLSRPELGDKRDVIPE